MVLKLYNTHTAKTNQPEGSKEKGYHKKERKKSNLEEQNFED